MYKCTNCPKSFKSRTRYETHVYSCKPPPEPSEPADDDTFSVASFSTTKSDLQLDREIYSDTEKLRSPAVRQSSRELSRENMNLKNDMKSMKFQLQNVKESSKLDKQRLQNNYEMKINRLTQEKNQLEYDINNMEMEMTKERDRLQKEFNNKLNMYKHQIDRSQSNNDEMIMLQKEIKMVKHDRDTLKATLERDFSVKKANLENELYQLKIDYENMKSGKSEELSHKLSQKDKELANMSTQSQQKINLLSDQVSSLKEQLNTTVENHKQELLQVEVDFNKRLEDFKARENSTFKNTEKDHLQQISILQNELKVTKTELENIKHNHVVELKSKEAEVSGLFQKLISKLETDIENIHKSHNQELAHVKRTCEDEIKNISIDKQSLYNKISENEAVIMGLRKEIEFNQRRFAEELKSEKSRLTMQYGEKDNEINYLINELKKAKQITSIQSTEYENKIANLVKSHNVKEAELTTNMNNLKYDLNSEINKVEKELNIANNNVVKLTTEYDFRIQSLQAQHEKELAMTTKKYEDMLVNYPIEIEKLSTKHTIETDKYTARIEYLEEENKNHIESLTNLQRKANERFQQQETMLDKAVKEESLKINEQYKAKFNTQNSEINSLKSLINTKNQDYEKLMEQYRTEIITLENKLQTINDAHNNTIEKMKNDHEKLELTIKSLHIELNEHKKCIMVKEGLKTQLKTFMEDFEKVNTENEANVKKIEEMTELIGKKDAHMLSLRADLKKIRSETRAYDDEYKKLGLQYEQKAKELEEKYKSIINENKEKDTMLNTVNRLSASLKQRLNTANAEVTPLKNTIAQKDKTIAELTQKLEKSTVNKNVSNDLSVMSAKYQRLNVEVARLNKEKMTETTKLKNDINTVMEELKLKTIELDNSKKHIGIITADYEKIKNYNNDTINNLENKLSTLQDSKSDLIEKISGLNIQLSEAKNNNEVLTARINEMKHEYIVKVNEFTRDMEVLNTKEHNYKNIIEDLQAKLSHHKILSDTFEKTMNDTEHKYTCKISELVNSNNKLTDELKNKSIEVKTIQDEYNTLISTYEKYRDTSTIKLKTQTDKYSALLKEKNKLNNMMDAIQAKFNGIEDNSSVIDILKNKLHDNEEKLKSTTIELDKTKALLHDTIKTHEKEVATYRQTIDESGKNIIEYKTLLNERDITIKNIQAELNRIDEYKSEYVHLQNQLKQQNQDYQNINIDKNNMELEYKSIIKDYEYKLKLSIDEIKNLKSILRSQETQIEERNETIKQLNHKLDTIKIENNDNLQKVQAELGTTKQKLNTVEIDHDKLKNIQSEFMKSRKSWTESNKTLKTDLETANKKVNQYEAELKTVNEKLHEYEDIVKSYKFTKEEEGNVNKQLLEALNNLKKEYNDYKQNSMDEADKLNKELRECKNKIETYSQTTRRLQQEDNINQQLLDTLNNVKTEYNDYKKNSITEANLLHEKIKNLTDEKEQIKRNHQELHSTATVKEEKIVNFMDKISSMESMLSIKNDENIRLKRDYEYIKNLYDEEKVGLLNEINRQTEKVSSVTEDRDKIHKTLLTVTEKLNNTTELCEMYKSKINEGVQKEIINVQSIQKTLHDTQSEYNIQIQTLQKELLNRDNILNDCHKTIEKLKLEINSLNTKLDGEKSKVDNMAEEYSKEINKLTSILKNKNIDIDNIKAKIHEEYTTQISDLNKKIQSHIDENKAIQQDFTSTKNKLLSTINNQKQEYDTFIRTKEEYVSQLHARDDKINDLQQQLQTEKTKSSTLSTEMFKDNAEVKSLQEQVKNIKNITRDELKKYEINEKHLKTQIENLQGMLNAKSPLNEKLEKEVSFTINNLKTTIADKDEEIEKIIKSKRQTEQDLLDQLNMYKKDYEKTQNNLIATEANVSTLQTQLKTEMEKYNNFVSISTEKDNTIDKLTRQLEDCTSFKDQQYELSKALEQLKDMKNENEKLRSDLAKKTREMENNNSTQQTLNTAHSLFIKYKTEVEALIAMNIETENKLRKCIETAQYQVMFDLLNESTINRKIADVKLTDSFQNLERILAK